MSTTTTRPSFCVSFASPRAPPSKPSSPEEMQAQYAAWTAWMKKFEKELTPWRAAEAGGRG